MSRANPADRPSRRRFFFEAGGGFLGLALGALFAKADSRPSAATPGTARPPRAKSVIFLFMCGGVSHIDTFDPKDLGENLSKPSKPGSLYKSIETAVPGVRVAVA